MLITLQIGYNEAIHNHSQLGPGRYTIGRNPDSDLSIGAQNEEVSSDHGAITISEDSSLDSPIGTIRDVGSTYGTYLNGFRIESTTKVRINGRTRNAPLEVPLFYGDCLHLGRKGWVVRVVRVDATMTECQPEMEVTDSGDLYVRGRLIDRADITGPLRSLLIESKQNQSETLTHEMIYRACHQRNREQAVPNLYAQQLITSLRKLLKEDERYTGFLVENIHNTGYVIKTTAI